MIMLKSNGGGEQTEIHPGFLWDEDSKSNFKKLLERPVISDKIESLLNSDTVRWASIKEILFQNISDADVTTKNSPREEKPKSEPWFDKE